MSRGSHDSELRLRELLHQLQQDELRDQALSRKIDESIESLREEIRRLYPRRPDPTL